MTDTLLDIKETSQKLRISSSFLYQLVDRKRISFYRIGKRLLFNQQQIDEFLGKQLNKARPANAK